MLSALLTLKWFVCTCKITAVTDGVQKCKFSYFYVYTRYLELIALLQGQNDAERFLYTDIVFETKLLVTVQCSQMKSVMWKNSKRETHSSKDKVYFCKENWDSYIA